LRDFIAPRYRPDANKVLAVISRMSEATAYDMMRDRMPVSISRRDAEEL
jgi:hypothetical protein